MCCIRCRERWTNEDVRRVEGASTACLSLAGHDGILPRGSFLPPSLLHPSCSLLRSHQPSLPPSVFTSLPLLFSSRHPHHNRSISYSVSNLDLEKKALCCLFDIFSSSIPPMDACLDLPLSICSLLSFFFASLCSTSAFSSSQLGL